MQKGQNLAANTDASQIPPKGGIAKNVSSLASTSGSKNKNKLSKKKRDTLKKKLESSMMILENIESNVDNMDAQGNETCKKIILVDKHASMTVTPLNVQQNFPLGGEPNSADTNVCQFNTDPILPSNEEDEYGVINSEDEVDNDNLPFTKQDDDDDISE